MRSVSGISKRCICSIEILLKYIFSKNYINITYSIYIITPMAQTSHLSLYDLLSIISGAEMTMDNIFSNLLNSVGSYVQERCN